MFGFGRVVFVGVNWFDYYVFIVEFGFDGDLSSVVVILNVCNFIFIGLLNNLMNIIGIGLWFDLNVEFYVFDVICVRSVKRFK